MVALCMATGVTMVGCSDDDSGATCNDGVIEGSEVCDGSQLGGGTCTAEGFTGGTISCNATCDGYDTSMCTDDVCGDGTITGSEQCEGTNLNNATCITRGFDGGDLACTGTCAFDESDCFNNCGDGTIQVGDEVCDGADLDNNDCTDEGFDAGTLACATDCASFDTTGCCNDNCPAEDDTQCTGDTLNTCTLGTNGCLDWVDTNCTTTGDVCSGTPAACQAACTSDCPAIDDTQCADASNLETCTDSGNGCINWASSPCTGGYCTGTPAVCEIDGSGNACNDVYNLAGRTYPHEVTGDWATGAYTFQGTCQDGANPIYMSYTVKSSNVGDLMFEVVDGGFNYPEISAWTTTEATGFCDGAAMTEIGCATGGTTTRTLTFDASNLNAGDVVYFLVGGDGINWQLTDPAITVTEVVCGDASIIGGESCDDGNTTAGDGCDAACHVETGYICTGEPSICTAVTQVDYTQTGLALAIPDNVYDGTLGSMACVSFAVPSTGTDTVGAAEVQIAMDHTWIGDLTIKVVSPANTVTTILSRPGYAETVDDGTGCCGDSSNLVVGSPVTFADSSANDAETMGAGGDTTLNACADDGICDFNPNPGAGPGTNGFADFNSESTIGTWQVCFGDSVGGDTGTVDSVTLSLLVL